MNTIELTFEQRLTKLMTQLHGRSDITKAETDEMFALHNMHFPGHQEYGKTCSTCRSRVYKAMQKVLNQLK